jgi:glycosyltransferase involved in cell wall biosynthesis
MSPAPRLSVIIPTYRREQVLCDTLASLLEQGEPGVEVIVVDQTPRHEEATSRFLESLQSERRIKLVREAAASLPRARNVGFQHASSDIILYIDDDVLLPPGFLHGHLDHYAEEGLDGLTGRIVLPGEDPAADRPLPVRPDSASDRLDLQPWRHTTPVRNPLHFIGANFSLRRRVIEANNGFSHAFTGSALGEEVEFIGRARRRGAIFLYDPGVWLRHCVAPDGGCRAQELAPFSRSRERMRNYYYALFHGAGWSAGLGLWSRRVTRRLSGAPPGTLPDLQPAGSGSRRPSRLLSAAGRFVGAGEGILRSLRDASVWGELDRLPPPRESPK